MSTIEDAEKGCIPTDPPPLYELNQSYRSPSKHFDNGIRFTKEDLTMADHNAIDLPALDAPRAENEAPGAENDAPGAENERLAAEHERLVLLIADNERRIANNERRIAANEPAPRRQAAAVRFIRRSSKAIRCIMVLTGIVCVWPLVLFSMASVGREFLCANVPKFAEILNQYPGTIMGILCTSASTIIRQFVYFDPSPGNILVFAMFDYAFAFAVGPVVASFVKLAPVSCDIQ